MKLYFSPGACSLAPHIVLRELGLPFETQLVNLRSKRLAGGADYKAINPKGAVPALELPDKQVLTEAAVVVQYLADQKPEVGLAPKPGTMDRVRLQEWLNFIATEVHKTSSVLFNPKTPAEWRTATIEALGTKFDYLSTALGPKSYLMGEAFTVADAYLFTILSWTHLFEIDLGRWPTLKAYHERVGARPAVRAALEAEQQAHG